MLTPGWTNGRVMIMGRLLDGDAVLGLIGDVRAVAEAFGNGYTAEDVGPSLTCSEADALASLMARCGHFDDAAAWLHGHAHGDDGGDAHYGLSWGALREYGRALVGEADAVDVLARALADNGGDDAPMRGEYRRATAALDGVAAGLASRGALVAALGGGLGWNAAEDALTPGGGA